MRKWHREVKRRVEAAGVEVRSILMGKTHVKWKIRQKGRRMMTYYTGSSPSDNRAAMNAVADMKRLTGRQPLVQSAAPREI